MFSFRGKGLHSLHSCCDSRYGAAQLLNMQVDDPVLACVLSEVPCDDDWDMSNGLERGYAKAGLKRYSVEYVDRLVRRKTVKEESESIASETYSKEKKNKLTAAPGADVKIEVKEHAVLVIDSKVISAGERKLDRAITDCKRLKSQLTVAASSKPEGLH